MNKKTTFTPLYDWLAEREDLSLLEKLIICRVLRFGEGGCFESYSTMAKAFHVDRSNLIKNIKSLVKKQWLAPLYETKYVRVLWVDPDRFSVGPLFDLPAVQKARGSGAKPPVNDSDGGGFEPSGSGAKPPKVVVQNHLSIERYNKNNNTHLEKQSLFEHPPEKIGIDQFWEEYPRKEAKQRVVAWFKKNKPSKEDIERMIYTIREQYSKGGRLYWGEKKHRQYVPLPITWLNDGDWQQAPTVEDLERQKAEHNRKKQKEENDRKESIRQEYGQFFRENTTEQLKHMLTQKKYTAFHWLIREIVQENESQINAAFARR